MKEPNPLLRKIFNEAAELADAQQRADYLASACGADKALRQRIEELLAADAEAGRFLGGVGDTVAKARRIVDAAGFREKSSDPGLHRFGDYELLEEIARGGMGIIYKARQVSLDRIVAVKLLLLGQYASEEFIHRFRIEASAAASLQHPNIVAIHEVGVHQGQHYFAMDFVDGPTLAQLAREQPLTAKRAAGYAKTIAEAIHFAHTRRILHRDLKPSNVLIDSNDQPRVTDFGLAKNLANDSDLTLTGQVMGSPSFMPPEQASGERGKMGPTSDVYSLGAILYHALTGRPPFVGQTVADTLQQVENREPVAPRLLIPSVPADLETICLRCLEKEPGKRFASAQELVEELGRFLRDEPIRSRPVRAPEKIWRWCRRKPAIAGLGVATILLLLAVAIGSPIAAWRIDRERRRAEGMAGKESQARRSAEQRLYVADMGIAFQAIEEANLGRARALLEAHRTRTGGQDWRGFEWRYLWGRCQGDELATLREPSGLVQRIAISPDGTLLAATTMGNAVKLWDPLTRRLLSTLVGHQARAYALAFSPIGKLLASGSWDRTVKLWDVGTASEVETIGGLPDWVRTVAFSPDGRTLAIGCENGFLRLWSCQSNSVVADLKGHTASVIAAIFAPDGRTLITGSDDAAVKIWDVGQRREITELRGHTGRITSLAVSADGAILASGGVDGTARLWSITTKKSLGVLDAHSGQVAGLAFSPTEQLLATANADSSVRIWDVTSQKIRTTLRGHLNEVLTIAFFPDGKALATGSKDETIKFWNPVVVHQAEVLKEFGSRVQAVGFAPDNRSLIAVSVTNGARRWDLSSLKEISPANILTPPPTLAFLPHHFGRLPWGFTTDGKQLAFRTTNQTVEVWDLITNQKSKVLDGYSNNVVCLSFFSEGKLLGTGDDSGVVQIWNVSQSRRVARFEAHEGWVSGLTLSPRDKILATGGADKLIKLWNPATGQKVATLSGHRDWIGPMAFSPDGRMLVTASFDGFLKVWEAQTCEELNTIPNAHKGFIFAISFSPDGKTLATCGVDGAVNLWNTSTWRLILTLKGHAAGVGCLAFSSDGNMLATGSDDLSVRIWRAPPFSETDVEISRAR